MSRKKKKKKARSTGPESIGRGEGGSELALLIMIFNLGFGMHRNTFEYLPFLLPGIIIMIQKFLGFFPTGVTLVEIHQKKKKKSDRANLLVSRRAGMGQ